MDGFRSLMRSVAARMPPAAAAARDTAFLSVELQRLFYGVDANETCAVATSALVVALLPLVGGSKSDKLRVAFGVVDADDRGAVTRSEMAALLCGVLSALFMLRSVPHILHESEEEVAAQLALPAIAESFVQMAVEWLEAVEGEGAVAGGSLTFVQFSEWYNAEGHRLAPFIELLALSKLRAFAAGEGGTPPSPPPPPSGSDAVLAFDLDPAEGGVSVTMSVADVDRVVSSLAGDAGLHAVLAPRLLEALLRLPTERPPRQASLTAAAVAWEAAAGGPVAPAAAAALMCAFDTLSGGDEFADVVDVAVASAVLAAGDKSTKLMACWTACGGTSSSSSSSEGAASASEWTPAPLLDRPQLRKLVQALAAGVSALSAGFRAVSHDARKDAVFAYSTAITNAVFEYAAERVDGGGSSGGSSVSFATFGKWYNDAGFRWMPWAELLNLTKWAALASPSLGAADAQRGSWGGSMDDGGDDGGEGGDEDDGGDDDDDGGDDEDYGGDDDGVAASAAALAEGTVFQLSLPSHPADVVVRVTPADCAHVHAVAALSGLSKLSVDDVAAHVDGWVTSEAGVAAGASGAAGFTPAAFVTMLQALVGEAAGAAEAHAVLAAAFDPIFSALSVSRSGDADDTGAIATAQALVALLLFAAGSKSDKMYAAFAAFDDDGDGELTPAQLRDLLAAIVEVVLAATAEGADLQPLLLARSTRYLAEAVASDILSNGDAATCTFERLTTYYNETGYLTIPHLELLNLKVRRRCSGTPLALLPRHSHTHPPRPHPPRVQKWQQSIEAAVGGEVAADETVGGDEGGDDGDDEGGDADDADGDAGDDDGDADDDDGGADGDGSPSDAALAAGIVSGGGGASDDGAVEGAAAADVTPA